MGMLYNSQRMGARSVRTYIIDRDLAVLQPTTGLRFHVAGVMHEDFAAQVCVVDVEVYFSR